MTALFRRTLVTALLAFLSASAAADGSVVVLQIEGGIGVATAEYLSSGIKHAEDQNANLVIIEMDTPGGLVSATRDIIQDILASDVPVATYISPAGARGDSAGTYIMFASHIAAMAPTTHLGAATPVSLNGDDVTPDQETEPTAEPESDGDAAADSENSETDDADEASDGETEREPPPRAGSAMDRKVLNDAVAYIRSLAERHGRNADWAEAAVVDAATLTAEEALEMNVIDIVAENQNDLLAQIDGREVKMETGMAAVDTENVTVDRFEPNWRIKILSAISQPEIILLLGMVGLYGLMYEGWNPGAIVPGVVGVICLLLAAYASQLLPVNYAGLALIVVGVGLMVAEAFAPSFGALGLGGIAAFVFGAIMMFDSGIPGFGISIAFVIGLALVAAAAIIWLIGFALKLRKRGAVSGRGSIIGGIGTAMDDFTGEGKVWLEGEAWAAVSTVPVQKDQQVIVTAMDGLTLTVKPASARDTGGAQLQT